MKINTVPTVVPPNWRDGSLLDFLRDYLGLTGTKFGCGAGYCGACTVHMDGAAVRACLIPLQAAMGRTITTIEGLSTAISGAENELHPVQQAWKEASVPQCGYCQPGQIMTATAFLRDNQNPTEEEITDAMNGNLCRCGTYPRIRTAVRRAAQLLRESDQT